MTEERPDKYYIPDNMTDNRHFFHVPDRNLVETAIAEAVIFYIMKLLPVSDMQVKVIIGAIVMILVGAVGVMGIKNESVVEFLMTAAKFHKKKRILHYRRCDQTNYEKQDETATEKRQESKAEELLRRIEDNAAKKIESRIREMQSKH